MSVCCRAQLVAVEQKLATAEVKQLQQQLQLSLSNCLLAAVRERERGGQSSVNSSVKVFNIVYVPFALFVVSVSFQFVFFFLEKFDYVVNIV